MNRLLRPEVAAFTPYVPGLSIDEIKEKYGLDTVIKMASNENPLGTSPLAQKAIKEKAAFGFRYPQSGNPHLNKAIESTFALSAGSVVTGNGSDEIIDLLYRVVCRPGQDNAVAFSPCFSMYELQAKLCGVELRQTSLAADFSFDFATLLSLVDDNTRLVFVTNPDNPSGYAVKADTLIELAKSLPENCLLVVDEAYADFTDPEEDYSLLPQLDSLQNVVVLRTFSKLYGLAGLRIGFGAMPSWLHSAMMRVKLPFSVNILAEAAAIAALEDVHFRRATRECVLTGRVDLQNRLADLGCTPLSSQANFVMFKAPDDAPDTKTIHEALLHRGIIIRPLASYGLPEHMRVSVGTAEENNAFIQALALTLKVNG
nr:histidinol-phosphate transaminase [Desulfovibrio inopinatus]